LADEVVPRAEWVAEAGLVQQGCRGGRHRFRGQAEQFQAALGIDRGSSSSHSLAWRAVRRILGR
jgi:hypothetical protein